MPGAGKEQTETYERRGKKDGKKDDEMKKKKKGPNKYDSLRRKATRACEARIGSADRPPVTTATGRSILALVSLGGDKLYIHRFAGASRFDGIEP